MDCDHYVLATSLADDLRQIILHLGQWHLGDFFSCSFNH